jgi:aldose 1-epimerase
VAPGIGGSVVRFVAILGGRRVDLLRSATPEAIEAGDPRRMGAFPLVPFSNRIRGGRFRFAGREVALPLNSPPMPHAIHGFGFQAPWRVVSHGDAALAIEHRHEGGAWPYPYVARQSFVLGPGGLTVAMEVENAGREAMPLGMGWHPYFPRTPKARLAAGVKQMWRTDAEVMPVALVAPPPTHRLDRGVRLRAVEMDNCFTGWDGRAVIDWPEWSARLTLTADPLFRFLVVFTPPDRDFFCVEPAGNCTDAFNLAAAGRQDTGMVTLGPSDMLRAAMTLRPESIR